MYRYLSLLCLCIVFLAAEIVAREAIINGEHAKEAAFPYQISLLDDSPNQVCGGGIIDEQFIVTAAHCVVKEDNEFRVERKFIVAGTDHFRKSKKPAVKAEIAKFLVPKTFNFNDFYDDIAVIKLKHRLEFSSHMNKLDLPTNKNETYDHEVAKIAGFGWDHVKVMRGLELGGNSDSRLRFALADVLSADQIGYDKKYMVAKKQICAKIRQHPPPKAGPAVCFGDSGSPLVVGNTIIGILSTIPGLCEEDYFGATYTRMTYYLHFIHNAVHGTNLDLMRTHEFH